MMPLMVPHIVLALGSTLVLVGTAIAAVTRKRPVHAT